MSSFLSVVSSIFPRCSRRAFLRTGTMAATAVAMPRTHRWLAPPVSLDEVPDAEQLHALARIALDAAQQTGAEYTDVQIRLRRSELLRWNRRGTLPELRTTRVAGVGVRAFANGYWGFSAADNIATTDLMARLGRTAAELAHTAASGKPRAVRFAPSPTVINGQWTMPVQIDPFTVSLEEKIDFLDATIDAALRRRYRDYLGFSAQVAFTKEERTFASSEGNSTSQTIFRTEGSFYLGVPPDLTTDRGGESGVRFLTPAGKGWEYIRTAPFREHFDQMIEDAIRDRRPKPVDVGRYDMVFDAYSIANILAVTLGEATVLDRAMGYRANTVGTSYLDDPLRMLGTLEVGSPLLTITTDRAMLGGAATVQWDDEGVAPIQATLVNQGVLTDYQTTREAAGWIAPYYERRGFPLRSNGCAGVYGATEPMAQYTPNLVMAPGREAVSFDDLVKSTRKGIAVMAGGSEADHQCLNGRVWGRMIEITNGKLGQPVVGGSIQFRAPEFWKALVAIGGPESVQHIGRTQSRAGSDADAAYTIAAVPAKVTGQSFIDIMRRA
jgi:TldD protein